MDLKDEVLEKLADLDCKDEIKDALKEHREEIVTGLNLEKDIGMLDVIQQKIVSRKLLVFGVATALLWFIGLDADTWGMIAMTYIGGQTTIDFAKVWKGA